MKSIPFIVPIVLGTSALHAEEIWTLYRTELGAPQTRIHLATVDAYLDRPKVQRTSQNRQNCRLTAGLLRLRSGSFMHSS